MGKSSVDPYERYYQAQLERAQRFEDFVADQFYRLGVPLVPYYSRQGQRRGENRAGIEIKFDQQYQKTGNLYIETKEKAHPNKADYVDSGIYRQDNSWLYAIGDFQTLFVFSKTLLRLLWKSNRYRRVQTPTSEGFLLCRLDAQRFAAKIIKVANID